MNRESDCAKLVCVGFDGLAVNDDLRSVIARGVRNVILFARNYRDRAQLMELCREIKSLAPHGEPIMICVDHEGGRVQRFLEGFALIPSMREIGRLVLGGDCEIAEHCAKRLGSGIAGELRACGIHMNLAPVLDVDSNPDNPVIGERSFGRDPHLVARLGCAMIETFQSNGLAACGKHFPGHGDTSTDSHFDLPRLTHDMQRLRDVELVPFAAAIAAGVACIMTSHVMFEALDPHYPATMSQRVITGLLRGDMGFDGVVITDDLEMKAIAEHFGAVQGAIMAAKAGADMLMCCHTPSLQHEMIDMLEKVVSDGTLAVAGVQRSLGRIAHLHAQHVG
ncbi:MAG TPA: beta-N-acetylhexosaminidase [Roseiflexaceae bacterium]|nr:beta-N-acetylhexosaminidase [Roseiflexaceae bacterium]